MQVVRLLEVISDKTDTPADDELVALVRDVLETEQGGKLVDYIVEKIKGLANA